MILRPTNSFNLVVTRDMQVQNTSNVYILCQTSSVTPITITLPRISSLLGVPNSTFGFRIFVTDDNNNAAAKNITIVPNTADKINGASSVVLNTNGATGHLLISGLRQWDFSSAAIGGGGGAGNTFERGVFTLTASGVFASGNVNGNAISYNSVTKVMTFPTAKKLKLAHINTATALDSPHKHPASYGKDDGILADCVLLQVSFESDFTNSINVGEFIGWRGKITSISDTSFDVSFTQVGSGLNIIGQLHLIETP